MYMHYLVHTFGCLLNITEINIIAIENAYLTN